jgi:hypothetical protein
MVLSHSGRKVHDFSSIGSAASPVNLFHLTENPFPSKRLQIEAVATEGFWGRRRLDPGIEYMPNPPRGHFCAVRLKGT